MKLVKSVYINKWSICTLILLSSYLESCQKLVTVDAPVTSTTGQSVYEGDITATAVLTSMYARISQGALVDPSSGLLTITKRAGLSADELNAWTGSNNNDIAFYRNNLSAISSSPTGPEIWNTCYSYIYTCNSALEGLNAATSLTPKVKQQLLGEAKFMRAFLYFYIVNLYGDAPLVLSTDYAVNRLLSRSAKNEVYNSIVSDLKSAQQLLSQNYLDITLQKASTDRARPTSWTATALLARVYLYMNDWSNAETQASSLINNANLFALNTIGNVFLRASSGNKEAIWELQPVNMNGSLFWNTEDAKVFVLTAAPAGLSASKNVFLNQMLVSAFEPGDARKTNWLGIYTDGTGTYYFPNKYKVAVAGSTITEYTMVFRLSEQFLIRAEARTQLGDLTNAKNDLNIIRQRASLGSTIANDKSSLLTAILHERQVELFTEWGHRWFDLKRTGNIDQIMNVVTPLKANGAAWQSYQQLYPLPLTDIQRNPNLIQNIGY